MLCIVESSASSSDSKDKEPHGVDGNIGVDLREHSQDIEKAITWKIVLLYRHSFGNTGGLSLVSRMVMLT